MEYVLASYLSLTNPIIRQLDSNQIFRYRVFLVSRFLHYPNPIAIATYLHMYLSFNYPKGNYQGLHHHSFVITHHACYLSHDIEYTYISGVDRKFFIGGHISTCFIKVVLD